MRTLVVEDDFVSRLLLSQILKSYGEVCLAENGREALLEFERALQEDDPFDLVCLDIMMPEVDGQTALRRMRTLEEDRGISSSDGAKIVMTTALDDLKSVSTAFMGLSDAYIVKPVDKGRLLAELQELGLTPQAKGG